MREVIYLYFLDTVKGVKERLRAKFGSAKIFAKILFGPFPLQIRVKRAAQVFKTKLSIDVISVSIPYSLYARPLRVYRY